MILIIRLDLGVRNVLNRTTICRKLLSGCDGDDLVRYHAVRFVYVAEGNGLFGVSTSHLIKQLRQASNINPKLKCLLNKDAAWPYY